MKFRSLFVVACVVFLACGGNTVPIQEPASGRVSASLVTCPTPAQLDTDLTAAAQAAVISLAGVNPLNCPEVLMTETWGGGKLVFSDSPEKPTVKAKLYEDTALAATSGTVYNRIYAYHVNGKASGNMRFTVLVKNTSASSGTLTVQLKGTAGPTTSYLYAGKLVFHRWLTSTASSGVSVGAGATVRLDSTWDSTDVAVNNLLSGVWDYSFGQTHQVTVCALDQNDAPLTVCPGLSVATRDVSHQRGTFPNADKVYDTASGVTIDTADGIQQFPLAGGTTNDTNAVGTDATDGSSQTLIGNYAVLYRMHLATIASDSANMGFLLNPRGGQWGGAVWAMPGGLLAGGKFLIPAASASTGDNTKGAVDGRYSPGTGGTNIWAQFMPTGGSAFPLRYTIVPH
jgi:hypothetical protein